MITITITIVETNRPLPSNDGDRGVIFQHVYSTHNRYLGRFVASLERDVVSTMIGDGGY